jgi:hypothetical protein
MSLPNKILVYNPKSTIAKLRDLDLQIQPYGTIDLRVKIPRLTEERWSEIRTKGDLAAKLKDASLTLNYSDHRIGPSEPATTESKVPFARRALAIPRGKVKQSDFIEKLQAEFSGDSILVAPESDIAKNTSDMINNIDFDGFDDPLAD